MSNYMVQKRFGPRGLRWYVMCDGKPMGSAASRRVAMLIREQVKANRGEPAYGFKAEAAPCDN